MATTMTREERAEILATLTPLQKTAVRELSTEVGKITREMHRLLSTPLFEYVETRESQAGDG